MPQSAEQQRTPAQQKQADRFARMGEDALSMAIQAYEAVGWRDLAGELLKVQQKATARQRQAERR